MGSRIPSHKLSGGLYVSCRPEQHKERPPTMAARAVPYTGGDVKKSGELGKMFDLTAGDKPPATSSSHNSGSTRSGSGPLSKPSLLQPTGLITSGPLSSSSSGNRRSGQAADVSAAAAPVKPASYGAAVTHAVDDVEFRIRVSRAAFWVPFVLFVAGFLVGIFMMVTVKKPIILIAVGGVFVLVVVVLIWNWCWGRRALLIFLLNYRNAELRSAKDGDFIKVTGVVTCGSIPLESSFQRRSRCIYVCTELQEYKGLKGKSANPKHCHFTWGSRHTERYVADFYISDFDSGLRALVKAGYGAKVTTFVKPATVVDVSKEKRELSPRLLEWLTERNLSTDDRVMRLKEGYIKEGNTVSVMGIVRRHENVLMIVPPQEPVSTGCQWLTCLFPTRLKGLILMCNETQNEDVIAV